MDGSFVCQHCETEMISTADFKLRLRPAKKMTLKALKLYHNPTLQLQASSTFNPNQSKWRKYTHRLSVPKNTVEIRCGNCSLSTSMSTLKPKYEQTVRETVVSTPRSAKRQKKQRGSHDLNAGLIIPPSMLQSPSPFSSAPRAAVPTTDWSQKRSSLFTAKETPTSTMKNVPRSSSESGPPYQKFTHEKRKKIKQEERKSKQKEVDGLRKALFKSKEANSSGNFSLSNFLDGSQ